MSGEVLRFFRGKRGNIIARLPSGKIALINKNYKGTFPQAGEEWICKIDFEKERFAVITPIEKLTTITVTVKEYEEFKCGHKKLIGEREETIKVGESEASKKVIERVVMEWKTLYCEQCCRRTVYACGHKMIDRHTQGQEYIDVPCEDCLFKTVQADIQRKAENLRKMEEEIEQRIKEMRNTIEVLRNECIINIPHSIESAPLGSGAKASIVWGNPICPSCGSEIQWKNRDDNGIVTCQCGAKYEYHCHTEWTEDMYNRGRCYISRWLIDLKKQEENEQKIAEIEKEIKRLQEELEKVREEIKDVERTVALETARRYGVNIEDVRKVCEDNEVSGYEVKVNGKIIDIIDDDSAIIPKTDDPIIETVLRAVFCFLM